MRIEVKVKTNSKKSEIKRINGKYLAFLKSLPESGKANEELLKLAKKFLGKPVRIVIGKTSKNKVLDC